MVRLWCWPALCCTEGLLHLCVYGSMEKNEYKEHRECVALGFNLMSQAMGAWSHILSDAALRKGAGLVFSILTFRVLLSVIVAGEELCPGDHN